MRWLLGSEALAIMNHATERSVVERAIARLERGAGVDAAGAPA